MNNKISKIAKRNGLGMIKCKMIEELNELLEAIEENDEQHILEEIADVYINIDVGDAITRFEPLVNNGTIIFN